MSTAAWFTLKCLLCILKVGSNLQQLLYFVHGGARAYRQELKFSLLSAMHWLKDRNDVVIRVITDRPGDYQGWPVELLPIESDQLNAWRGTYGYVHRAKACAIAAAMPLAEKTLFLDSDTVICRDPRILFKSVDATHAVLDEREWTWGEVRRKSSFEAFAMDLTRQGAEPDEGCWLYNSGICGLHAEHQRRVEKAIALIDTWHNHAVRIHTLEQIALSFSLADICITEGRGIIRHYYAEKKFMHLRLAHFFERYGEAFTPALLQHWQEVPLRKPVPSVWHRLHIKWLIRKLKGPQARAARKLLYGCLVPKDSYAGVCSEVWWDSALNDLDGCPEESMLAKGVWPDSIPRCHRNAQVDVAMQYIRAQMSKRPKA